MLEATLERIRVDSIYQYKEILRDHEPEGNETPCLGVSSAIIEDVIVEEAPANPQN